MSMPPFQINHREWQALFDEPHHLLKVYAAIRRYMDYATGIAGLHPHHFSEQFFRELLYVEPRPGRSKSVSGSPSKKEIYYSIEALTKVVCRNDLKTPLIIPRKDLGHFVFELPLATTDLSVQKQWGTNGGLMGDAIGNEDKPKKPSKNKRIPEEVAGNGEHNFSDYFAQSGTPPDVRTTDLSKDKSLSHAPAHGRRLPEDWTLPEDWREWAETERPDLNINLVADTFKDHWLAKPGKDGRKANWNATWRNWVRREKKQRLETTRHEDNRRNHKLSAAERAIEDEREFERRQQAEYCRVYDIAGQRIK